MEKNRPTGLAASGATIMPRLVEAYPSLSAAHRKAADYVLANPFRAATKTIDEFAQAVGISVATANRFARSLDFDGYPQFRAALVRAFESTMAPVEKLRSGLERKATSAEIVAASLEEDLDNIQGTLRQLNSAACEQAVDMILRAPRILILGFSTSAYLGSIMAHRLELCCPLVQTAGDDAGPSQAARRLFKLNPEDLVIAIAFPRYSKFTVELAELARKRLASVLAVTDTPASPLVPLADLVLYAKTERHLSSSSEAAALALLEALCGAVVHRFKNSLRTATELTEHLLPYLYTGPSQESPPGATPVPAHARKPT